MWVTLDTIRIFFCRKLIRCLLQILDRDRQEDFDSCLLKAWLSQFNTSFDGCPYSRSSHQHHTITETLYYLAGNFPHETWEKNFCNKSPFPAFSSSFRIDGISFSNSSPTLLDSLFEGTSEDVNVPVYLNAFKPELSWQSEISNTLNSSIKLFMTFMSWSQLSKSCFLDEGGVWHLDGDTFLNGVDVRSDGEALIFFLCGKGESSLVHVLRSLFLAYDVFFFCAK